MPTTNSTPAARGREAVVYMSRVSIARDKERSEELRKKKIPEKIRQLRAIGTSRSDELARQNAQEELDQLELELAQITDRLANAEVPCGSVDRVDIGSKVTFSLEGKPKTLTLVSGNGAPIRDETISHQSPIGQALVGKKVGDAFVVTLDSERQINVEVTDICIEE